MSKVVYPKEALQVFQDYKIGLPKDLETQIKQIVQKYLVVWCCVVLFVEKTTKSMQIYEIFSNFTEFYSKQHNLINNKTYEKNLISIGSGGLHVCRLYSRAGAES